MSTCKCCGDDCSPFILSQSIRAISCESCRTLFVEHLSALKVVEPWNMSNVTPTFKAALAHRRRKQAAKLIRHLREAVQGVRTLDYGCGQAAFPRFLSDRGFDCWGCDMPSANCELQISSDRFIPIKSPWEMPNLEGVSTVTMLDVLEHSAAPDTLIAGFRNRGVRSLLIKVPMLLGPLGLISLTLGKLGKPALLEKLLLAGEISPHYNFFTKRGLCRLLEKEGFTVKKTLRLADVGAEFPQRFRTADGSPIRGMKAAVLTVGGIGLEAIAPLWADSAAVFAERV